MLYLWRDCYEIWGADLSGALRSSLGSWKILLEGKVIGRVSSYFSFTVRAYPSLIPTFREREWALAEGKSLTG